MAYAKLNSNIAITLIGDDGDAVELVNGSMEDTISAAAFVSARFVQEVDESFASVYDGSLGPDNCFVYMKYEGSGYCVVVFRGTSSEFFLLYPGECLVVDTYSSGNDVRAKTIGGGGKLESIWGYHA